MTKARKILVPVDFGDTATVAARAASHMAEALDATIVALYADSFLPPVAYADIPVAWYSENVEELKTAAAQKLASFLGEHIAAGVDIEPRIVADTPVHAILSIATTEPIEMIVMGTHGRSGWKRALLGSIAESVLHETDVPVLTIRHSESKPFEGTAGVRRVLCPVNYSDVAREALGKAVALADAFDAEVYVVHVVEAANHPVSDAEADELREWIPSELRHRCCYKELVIHGNAAEQVIDLASKIEADLIVIGAQHKRFFDSTVIGTTTDRIVRHSHCPVLTVTRPAGEPAQVRDEAAIAHDD
jgi:nucleotide-binding universal stress UspA family protein